MHGLGRAIAGLLFLCIYIRMAAKGKSPGGIIHDLSRLLIELGVTQADFAKSLGISQGYLSKLLKGKHKPGRLLEVRCRRLLGAQKSSQTELQDWLAAVEDAARKSNDFRALVSAAMKIMH